MKDFKLTILGYLLFKSAMGATTIDNENKSIQMPVSQRSSIKMRCEEFSGQRSNVHCAAMCGIYSCPIWGINGDQCTLCGGQNPTNYLISQPGLSLPYDNMYLGKYH